MRALWSSRAHLKSELLDAPSLSLFGVCVESVSVCVCVCVCVCECVLKCVARHVLGVLVYPL